MNYQTAFAYQRIGTNTKGPILTALLPYLLHLKLFTLLTFVYMNSEVEVQGFLFYRRVSVNILHLSIYTV